MNRVTYTVGQRFNRHQELIGGVAGKRHSAITRVAKVFGGVTVFEGSGAWVDPRGKLVSESVLRFEVFTDEPIQIVEAVGQDLRELFEQEQVVVTTEKLGTMSFLEEPVFATGAA